MGRAWVLTWLLYIALMGWIMGKPNAPAGSSPGTVEIMEMNEGPDPFGTGI